MNKALILIALMLFATPGLGDERLAQAGQSLDESGEIHLGLFNNGERDGYMRLGWRRDQDSLRVYDRTMMPSAEVFESLAAEMDPATLAPRSVDILFYQGTAIMEISLGAESGVISGSRTVRRPTVAPDTREVSTELPAATVFRAMSFILPLTLNASPGDRFAWTWYAPMGNTVDEVTLTARDGGSVETPAGSFDTTVYELRGGTPENDIYVSKGEKAEIVRIDVLGQPLQFLAVDSAQSDP